MVDLDIIEPVQKLTEGVNRLIIVEKPNRKPQVCLKPRPLNKAFKHKHLKLSIAGEIFSQMSGASYFLKLDASSGYWQIKQSSNLLAFGTHFRKYPFKCLPYGIHSAA